MPERKHNLPTSYDRLDGQVTGPVLDSIVISPRSHGRLHLPGEHSADSLPPAHTVKITSTDPGNSGIYAEDRQLGAPDRYLVSYDVWNHRDSPAFAEIVRADETAQQSTP
jgi:hypothetical protein